MDVRRLAHAMVGALLLVAGVALLVLPGPGLLLVLAGLVLLSTAFPRLARYVEPVRRRALRTAEMSVSSPWRVAGSSVAGAALVAAGLVWGLVPDLPFGGWATGASLVLSGAVLFVLLGYSHRRLGRGATVPGEPGRRGVRLP